MKAASIDHYGKIEETVRITDVPKPTVGPGEVLVEVKAAGVNPVDWKIAEGYMGGGQAHFPMVLGNDLAGTVVETGEGVTRFKQGDEVYGRVDRKHAGTFAEYAAVDEQTLAHKPRNLHFAEAAAVPLAALTAWQALFEHARLQRGQRVLIQAGSGGVGSFAIQFAKHAGAQVATTVSTANVDLAQSLGADWVIDYKKQRFEDVIRDFDAALDTLAGDIQARSLKVLKSGGVLVSTVGVASQSRQERPDVRFEAMVMHPDGAQLAQITRLIEAGTVKPVVDRHFPLEQTKDALLYSRTGHAHGKIVITPH
jgi:NADPH:quinone reductase-like Zn-dependent oxidoreductase